MMTLALFLALATSAAASTDTLAGFETTSFWVKSYTIPRAFCLHRLVVETPRIDAALINKIACPLDARESGEAEFYAACGLPDDQIHESVQALRRSTKIVYQQEECLPADGYPELAYKYDHLKSEFERVSISSTNSPGISGLYDTQIKTLGGLLASIDRAKTPQLEVFVSTGGRCVGMGCREFLDSHWPSTRNWQKFRQSANEEFSPWARHLRPVCSQIPVDRVQIDAPDNSPEAEEAKRILRKIGKVHEENGCAWGDAPIFMVFTNESKVLVQKTIMELPALKAFTRNTARASFITDEQRFDILNRELAKIDLSKAPHIRALVAAEIARVKSTAMIMKKYEAGHLIITTFAVKK